MFAYANSVNFEYIWTFTLHCTFELIQALHLEVPVQHVRGGRPQLRGGEPAAPADDLHIPASNRNEIYNLTKALISNINQYIQEITKFII